MMQNISVYISEVSDNENTPLPSYIDEKRITNQRVLAEKRSAYSLLCSAVKEKYGVDLDIKRLTKTENGKPQYPGFCFSLSHSKELCAVALSDEDIGIDIEEEISKERKSRITKRILHENESPDADVTELWTKKEAIFKLTGGKTFIPSETDTTAYNTDTRELSHKGKRYVVSVASHNKCKIKDENG